MHFLFECPRDLQARPFQLPTRCRYATASCIFSRQKPRSVRTLHTVEPLSSRLTVEQCSILELVVALVQPVDSTQDMTAQFLQMPGMFLCHTSQLFLDPRRLQPDVAQVAVSLMKTARYRCLCANWHNVGPLYSARIACAKSCKAQGIKCYPTAFPWAAGQPG